MTNIMVDIETLDTQESAIIISIGLVKFDLEKGILGEELYIELGLPALKEQLIYERTFSLDNFVWWAQQSDGARAVWAPNENKSSNTQAFQLMYDFFDVEDRIKLWGNGSTFDNVILRSYFNTFGEKVPWHYAGDLCYRTMKNMFGNKAKLERVGEHHNALADAKTQALHLIAMHKAIHKEKK